MRGLTGSDAQRRHLALRAAHTVGLTEAHESSAAWLAAHIVEHVTNQPGLADVSLPLQVLDIGCGDGATGVGVAHLLGQYPRLRRKKFQVWLRGLDKSAGAVAAARQIYATSGIAQHDAQEGDALNLPFDEDAFECVLMLRMLNQTGDISSALSEAARVLWPGGMLFVATTDIAYSAAERARLDSPLRAAHERAMAALGFPPRLYAHSTAPDQRLNAENAQSWLRPLFNDVLDERYQRQLVFRDLSALMEFYATGLMLHKADSIDDTPDVAPEQWAALYAAVETEMSKLLVMRKVVAWSDGLALIVATAKR